MVADRPKIAVEQIECKRGVAPKQWTIVWRVQNLGGQPLEILSARLPHGKLRGEERQFYPSLIVPAEGSVTIELSPIFDEMPGTIVENAFLILLVRWARARWRIFVRFSTTANSKAEPETVTELITTQEVGFSGVVD